MESARLLNSNLLLIPSTSSLGHLWQGDEHGHSSLYFKITSCPHQEEGREGPPPMCLHPAELKRSLECNLVAFVLCFKWLFLKSNGNRHEGMSSDGPPLNYWEEKPILVDYCAKLCSESLTYPGIRASRPG